MALITRQGKGSKLTIVEMDDNLLYLQGLSGFTDDISFTGLTDNEFTNLQH